jgi:uncharacterized protein (UPF0333 family)
MKQRSQISTNPFYALLVIVGLLFSITACSYVVLILNSLQPEKAAALRESSSGFLYFMNKHGLTIIIAELSVLAVLTFAVIGTDDYFTRHNNTSDNDQPASPEKDNA